MSSLARSDSDDYVIREYRTSDRDGFLSLYADVWGRSKDTDWFEWRFEENPFAHDVEMVVATCGGRIVGAEPLLAFRSLQVTGRSKLDSRSTGSCTPTIAAGDSSCV